MYNISNICHICIGATMPSIFDIFGKRAKVDKPENPAATKPALGSSWLDSRSNADGNATKWQGERIEHAKAMRNLSFDDGPD